MRHSAHLDCASWRVAIGIEQVQLARSLSHDHAELAVWREQRMVWRGARRNLRDDLIGCHVQDLQGVHAGLGEEHLGSVRADVQRPRRVVDRDRARHGATGDVDDCQCLGACLLTGRVHRLAIGSDGEVVGLRDRHLPDHLVGAGVDRLDLVGTEASHQDAAAVGSNGQAVRRRAGVDGRGDLVGSGVDDRHDRVAIAAGIDPLVVGGNHQPVRASRNGNRLRDLIAGRIDHGDGVVAEQANVGLGRGGCGVLCRGHWTGARGERGHRPQGSADGRNPRCHARGVQRKSEVSHAYCPPRAELIGGTARAILPRARHLPSLPNNRATSAWMVSRRSLLGLDLAPDRGSRAWELDVRPRSPAN